jgi:hypothetical protein
MTRYLLIVDFQPARGHLLELSGDLASAAAMYRLAARRTTNLAEQRHLRLRVARLLTRRV